MNLDPPKNNEEEEDPDHYFEKGFLVFTRHYLIRRGHCCGNRCRHCPYAPKYIQGNRVLDGHGDQSL